jgi:hypothetical protein
MSEWTDEQAVLASEQISKLGWRFKRVFSEDALTEYLEDCQSIEFDALWAAIKQAREERKSMPVPADLREYASAWSRRRAYAKGKDLERMAQDTGEMHCPICEDSGWAHLDCDETGAVLPGAQPYNGRLDGRRARTVSRVCVCRDTNPRWMAKNAANSAAIARTAGQKYTTHRD